MWVSTSEKSRQILRNSETGNRQKHLRGRRCLIGGAAPSKRLGVVLRTLLAAARQRRAAAPTPPSMPTRFVAKRRGQALSGCLAENDVIPSKENSLRIVRNSL